MWEWLGHIFRRGTAEEPGPAIEEEPEAEDVYGRLDKLEERVQRLDERTRKQRWREEGAGVAAPPVPNSAGTDRRKVELMHAFQASQRART